jgi:hypothetical protein
MSNTKPECGDLTSELGLSVRMVQEQGKPGGPGLGLCSVELVCEEINVPIRYGRSKISTGDVPKATTVVGKRTRGGGLGN